MEVAIHLLGFVLVVVGAKLVVVGAGVLPLGAGLDTEELHEVVDFDLVVLATEGLSSAEESIFGLDRADLLLRRPLLASFFLVVVTVVSFTTFFFILITISLGAVELFFVLLGLSVVCIDETLESLVGSVPWDGLNLFNGSKRINLRVGLGSDSSKPVRTLEREGTWQLVPADEIGLVVSHVNRGVLGV